ncbi:Pycsar system effector family protein [Streptomyces sp. NPDC046821]|uniref:Pycsar system effector family protein n=1 Tax=Streptomyces sp. NPDC046821 TaxID=3154702 RepID=UPI0033F2D3A7
MAPTGQAAGDHPAQYMFTTLQTTHQHADTKAGILAAAQAALAGTAGSWIGRSMSAWERGGAAGAFAGVSLALFVCGLVGGVVCLAATLWPRMLGGPAGNRYCFVQLASGSDILPSDPPSSADANRDEATDRRELSHTVRFLAHVAVRKYRWLSGAVVCTAIMGVSAGLSATLLPALI